MKKFNTMHANLIATPNMLRIASESQNGSPYDGF